MVESLNKYASRTSSICTANANPVITQGYSLLHGWNKTTNNRCNYAYTPSMQLKAGVNPNPEPDASLGSLNRYMHTIERCKTIFNSYLVDLHSKCDSRDTDRLHRGVWRK